MKTPGTAPRPVELHRWLARAVVVIVAGLIPWTVYLAWSLPGHFRAHNWRVAWVGFDAALIAVLAYTAWAAWARRQILAPTAIVAATMLICDAWFDVNTSFGTRGEALTIVAALGGNLPLAFVFILLARRIMLRSAAMLAEARGAEDRPRHAHDVTMPFATTWHDDTAGLRAARAQPPVRDLQQQSPDDIAAVVVVVVVPQPGAPPQTTVPHTGPGGAAPGDDRHGHAGPAGSERSGDGRP
jgi:hypothetical protein